MLTGIIGDQRPTLSLEDKKDDDGRTNSKDKTKPSFLREKILEKWKAEKVCFFLFKKVLCALVMCELHIILGLGH